MVFEKSDLRKPAWVTFRHHRDTEDDEEWGKVGKSDKTHTEVYVPTGPTLLGAFELFGFGAGLAAVIFIWKRKRHLAETIGTLTMATATTLFSYTLDWEFGLLIILPSLFSVILLEREYHSIRSRLAKWWT